MKKITFLIVFGFILVGSPVGAVMEREPRKDRPVVNWSEVEGIIQKGLMEKQVLDIQSLAEEDLVPALGTVLQLNEDLTEGVSFEDLEQVYTAEMINKNNGTKMAVVEWKQNYDGVRVDVPGIRALVKYAPTLSEYALMLMEITVINPGVFAFVETTDQTAAKVNLARGEVEVDLGEPVSTERMIRYQDGEWAIEYELVFEGDKYQKYVVRGESVKVEDRREHAAPPSVTGAVKGMGHPGSYSNPNLSALELVDLAVQIGTVVRYTDPLGKFKFSNLASGLLTATLEGHWAKVIDNNHPVFSFSGNVSWAQPVNILWNASNQDEFTTAQIDGYYHTTFAHNWLKQYLPNFTGIDHKLDVVVNDPNGSCNAWYTQPGTGGHEIGFLASGGGVWNRKYFECENFAQDDIVYHEYGHFLETVTGGHSPMDGWEDLLGVLITGDPVTFAGPYAEFLPARTAENDFKFRDIFEGHFSGMAWQGFVWDLWQNMKSIYGPAVGDEKLKQLVLPVVLGNPQSIPQGVIDTLLLDDDDNNLANGTPHSPQIILAAFLHNLYPFPEHMSFGPTLEEQKVIDRSITTQIPVFGQILSQQFLAPFASFQVLVGPGPDPDPQSWTPITGPITTLPTGTWATWDVSGLAPGTYTVAVLVNTANPLIKYQVRSTVHVDYPLTRLSASNVQDFSGSRMVSGPQILDVHSGSSTFITFPSQSFPGNASISGNFVAYNFYAAPWVVNDTHKIFVYDIGAGTGQAVYTQNSLMDAIDNDGNIIVWQDERNGNWDIYGCDYDPGTAQCTPVQITSHPSNQVMPSVRGEILVWQDDRNGSWDIYLMHLPTLFEFQVTNNSADQITPVVDGLRIVWEDNRNGNWDIYMMDLTTLTETQISSTPDASLYPSISGDRIVWSEQKKIGGYVGRAKIHYYNLATQQGGVVSPSFEAKSVNPFVSGNTAVFVSEADADFMFGPRPWVYKEMIP